MGRYETGPMTLGALVVWTHADAKVLVISSLENLIHEVVGV